MGVYKELNTVVMATKQIVFTAKLLERLDHGVNTIAFICIGSLI